MLEHLIAIFVNALTLLLMLSGMFFMLVGALGVVRLPDFYARSSAASKCVTLGTAGLLLSMLLYLAIGTEVTDPDALKSNVVTELEVSIGDDTNRPAASIKGLLVIAFIFVAAPVGSHMLARAAHLAGVRMWRGTLSDDLADDRDEEPAIGEHRTSGDTPDPDVTGEDATA